MAHRTLGKHDRTGLSVRGLFKLFPDDATPEEWFMSKRWPEGQHWPYCGSANVLSGAKHYTMPRAVQCYDAKALDRRYEPTPAEMETDGSVPVSPERLADALVKGGVQRREKRKATA